MMLSFLNDCKINGAGGGAFRPPNWARVKQSWHVVRLLALVCEESLTPGIGQIIVLHVGSF